MYQAEIDAMLSRHRPHKLMRWRCICGRIHPCGARRIALDELQRQQSVQLGQWYVEYFRGQGRSPR
jgi:hypothetical protein